MTYTSNSDDLFLEVSNVFATEKQLKKPKISPESSRKHSTRDSSPCGKTARCSPGNFQNYAHFIY